MKTKIKLVLLILISIFHSCVMRPEKPNVPKEYHDLLVKVENLKVSMIDYMKNAHPYYTENDVNKCVEILHNYIQQTVKTNSKFEGLKIVKSTILDLNELNKKLSGQLIETSEREKIAEIIILTGNKKGYNSMDEDITEEWREW